MCKQLPEHYKLPLYPNDCHATMLGKGFFYLALLIAKGFLAVEARSPFSPQVEFGHASEVPLIDNSNFDKEDVLRKSTYEARFTFAFMIHCSPGVSY